MDKTTTSSSATTTAAAATSSSAPNDRPFLKKGSEKAFKLAATITAEEEQPLAQKTNISRFRDKSNADQHHKSEHDQQQQLQQSHTAEVENEEEVILPPPMKPIQDSQAIINNGPNVAASSVVEQSPCKRVSICAAAPIFWAEKNVVIVHCETGDKQFRLCYVIVFPTFIKYWTKWIWWWANGNKVYSLIFIFNCDVLHSRKVRHSCNVSHSRVINSIFIQYKNTLFPSYNTSTL